MAAYFNGDCQLDECQINNNDSNMKSLNCEEEVSQNVDHFKVN
jgi:hypothetical protein